jgi:signal transduction histidine kinase
VHAAYAIAPVLICKFMLMVLRKHHGRVRLALDGYLVMTVPVSLLIAVGRMPALWPAWQTVLVMLSLWVAAITIHHSVRNGGAEPRVLAVVVMLTAAAAVRDLVVIRLLSGGYGTSSWSRYAWILFGLTLGWIIAEQLRKATLAVARLNVTLSERLAAQEANLQAAFRERMDAERREAVSEERLRLTRDMHDGLGSQLAGALHLARNPNVPREALAAHLAEALDQLKLTVDAMQDIEGDIASLLGALRYRISPRVEAAGIRLAWAVEALPPMPRWTAQQSRDLQLLLYEALSNVLQHASATSVRLQARVRPGHATIEIILSDNGRGFDASGTDAPLPASGDTAITTPAQRGQGSANMRLRARRLGAQLDVQSSPMGTRICLTLPLADVTQSEPSRT